LEDNINMDLEEIWCKGVGWIELAKVRLSAWKPEVFYGFPHASMRILGW